MAKPTREEAKAQGLCVRCKVEPNKEGKLQCDKCLERGRLEKKEHYANLKPKPTNRHRQVPLEIALRVIEDLRKYKVQYKLSNTKLAKMVGCCAWSLTGWLQGRYKPRPASIKALVKAGITSVKLSDDVQKEAVSKVLGDIDKGNMIPRPYVRKVSMPTLVSNQLKLLIDDYVEGLKTPRTHDEYVVSRQEFINKMYFTCKQGG